VTVAALGGRRIDPANAPYTRFPLTNVDLVRGRIDELFARLSVSWLVSSAACGADLLAQEAAAARGIERTIVLPFDRTTFRETSVVDRPGDWGALFDRLIDDLERRGRVIDLQLSADDDEAYTRANLAILDEAQRRASAAGSEVRCVVVWDGKPRGPDDITLAFADAARARGIDVTEKSTL
jgi:hypothetical protein